MQSVLEMAGSGSQEISQRFNAVMGRLHVKERYDKLTELAKENPMRATFVAVAFAVCVFPTLIFLGFVASSICFGIICLLLVEGKIQLPAGK